MKNILLLTIIGTAFLFLSCGTPAQSVNKPKDAKSPESTKQKQFIMMATTTSTYDTGLLDYLNPKFTEKTGIDMRVVSLGTGAAIKAGEAGDADLILVHDRAGELKFVEEGYGVNRREVMYNDFIIVGPPDNPAGLGQTDTASDAFAKIAKKGSLFISRGDDSGTHRKEQDIWKASGMPMEEQEQTLVKEGKPMAFKMVKPEGTWSLSIGQGMGQALTIANEKRAYVLADEGTYIAYKDKIDLIILNQGDASLRNQYGIIAVNPEKHPTTKYDLAMKYIDWITSPEGQKLIADFKKGGEQMFYPDYNGGVLSG